MEKAINLLKKVNGNYLNIYFVISIQSNGKITLESVPFLDEDYAQIQCKFKNEIEKTTKYKVFRTVADLYN